MRGDVEQPDADRADAPDARRSRRRRPRARRGTARRPLRGPGSADVVRDAAVTSGSTSASLGRCSRPAPHGYYAGGADDELDPPRQRRTPSGACSLRPRMLVDVEAATTRTTVLGEEIELPVLVAPVAFQRVAHPDGEVAMARAARDAGTIMCLSTLATATPPRWPRSADSRWFQLYVLRDEGVTRDLIAQAREDGFNAIVADRRRAGARQPRARPPHGLRRSVRACVIASFGRGGLTPREVFEQISSSLTWRDLERIAGEAGLPVLVKGVLGAEDARLACEHGAAGIVVSNHGGRQLDGVAAIDRRAARGRRRRRRPGRGARRRRHPARHGRRQGARARRPWQCSPAALRSGASP